MRACVRAMIGPVDMASLELLHPLSMRTDGLADLNCQPVLGLKTWLSCTAQLHGSAAC